MIPLSDRLGEMMAPQTLVTAVIISPEGKAQLDPGALHGRSELESRFEVVHRKELVGEAQSCWVVWVAIELDAANQARCYKGLSVSELFINPERRVAYKSLAQQVNRMEEAVRGNVKIDRLNPQERRLLKDQLVAINAQLWEASSEALKQALTS